jgi:hypothetical protein
MGSGFEQAPSLILKGLRQYPAPIHIASLKHIVGALRSMEPGVITKSVDELASRSSHVEFGGHGGNIGGKTAMSARWARAAVAGQPSIR